MPGSNLPISPRAVAAMRTCHAVAAVATGFVIAAILLDWPRVGLAAIVVVVFALLLSMESLRVLVLSLREYRDEA